MLAIAILVIFGLLALCGTCLYIEKRAAEQDPKFMKIRDNIMEFCKK